MALSMTITLKSGIEVQNAYHRIDSEGGTKLHRIGVIKAYLSKEAYDNGNTELEPGETYEFVPSSETDSPNYIQQGYGYIKTTDKYATAVDC